MRLEWLAIGITLAATFSTFGYPLLFDRLLLGLLIVTALVSFKWDKNLFTLCLIFIGEVVIEETGWFFSNGNRYFLVPSYIYLLFACWLTAYSLLGKVSLTLAITVIGAELYWFYTEKEGPRLFWHALVCANLLVVKHLALIRPHYCSLRFRNLYGDWKITKTDIDIGYVVGLSLFHEFLNIGEYLVRHIAGYPMMIIYNTYPIVAHGIIAIVFYLFLRALSDKGHDQTFGYNLPFNDHIIA